MMRPHPGFGGSGLMMHVCSRCKKHMGIQPDGSVTTTWTGRHGEYCSKRCLTLAEQTGSKIVHKQSSKVKGNEKVKIQASPKVKINAPAKVKMESGQEKVKTPPPLEQVKTREPAEKVKTRKELRAERRVVIQALRRAYRQNASREPTIAEVRRALTKRGLTASVRTVWLDLKYIREVIRKS